MPVELLQVYGLVGNNRHGDLLPNAWHAYSVRMPVFILLGTF